MVRDGQLPYDPACVFHLEMMISLAGRAKQHIGETWYAALPSFGLKLIVVGLSYSSIFPPCLDRRNRTLYSSSSEPSSGFFD